MAQIPLQIVPHDEQAGPAHGIALLLAVGSAVESLAESGWLALRLTTALREADPDDAGALVLHHAQITPLFTVVLWRSDDPTRLVESVDRFLDRLLGPRWDDLAPADVVAPSGDPVVEALVEYFGAQSPGLAACPPWALQNLDESRLALTEEWFTARGSVLLSDFAPPPGWRPCLPDLPAPVVRKVRPLFEGLPAHRFAGAVTGIVAPVPRTWAATALASLLDRLVHRELRQRLGLAYSPRASYRVCDGDSAVIVLTVDSHETNAIKSLHEVLQRVACEGVDPDDLAAVVAERAAGERGGLFAAVQQHIETAFSGRANDDRASLAEVTTADVQGLARQMLSGALYLGPWRVPEVPELQPVLQYATDLAATHRHINAPRNRLRMELRDQILWCSHNDAQSRPITAAAMRLDQVVCCFCHPDGAITLVDIGARACEVDPLCWHEGQALVDEIKAALAPALCVRGWERDTAEVEARRSRLPWWRRWIRWQPGEALTPVPAGAEQLGVTRLRTIVSGLATVSVVPLLFLALALTRLPALQGPANRPLGPLAVIVVLGLLALVVMLGIWLARVAQRPRERDRGRQSLAELMKGPTWCP